MVIQALKEVFDEELTKLRSEIGSYLSEEAIWHIEKNIANSAGNLCLHLVGNLNNYIGAQIGGSNYIRNRNLEFSLKGISQVELLRKIDDTIKIVLTSLDKLKVEDLNDECQISPSEKSTRGYFLFHLVAHLTYHLGQINYHRRLLDQKI